MPHSISYTVAFAAAICIVCAILVSSSAVSLSDLQQANAVLDRRKNVLLAAGLIQEGESLSREQVNERFGTVKAVVVELETGDTASDVDPGTYDQQKAKTDTDLSRAAPPNMAGVKRLPKYALAYHVLGENEEVKMLVLPVEGYGLWSTLYGYLALDADTRTIRGLTFYQHGETPGLGGEVDNPNWKALWHGRIAFDENWDPVIAVIKGPAGPPEEDPHRVDGLSGATITSRGVTNMMHFWLGENGFGPYLEKFRESRQVS